MSPGPGPRQARCGSCERNIEFVLTPSGKLNPLVVGHSDKPGNIIILRGPAPLGHLAITLSGPMLELAKKEALPLRVSHFADCPFAARHAKQAAA